MTESSERILATIMFTDMVGYTALMQEDEALARKKRDRHREVFEQLHQKYNGRIIQYFGDGTLSIFQNATDATQCAIDLQLQLKEPIQVPLRIGMHLGEIVLEEDNVIGDAVNIASRVESFAATGSVLVSREVVNQLKNQKQFSFQSMGAFHFKNVRQSKELFAIKQEGLIVPSPEELSGKGNREVPRHNLPSFLTSFVGREEEIEEIIELVKTNRLVTLTGPGGTGKTRLSLKIGERLLYEFQDGLRWIPLSAVLYPDMAGFAMAEVLNIKPGIREIQEDLIAFLSDKEMLLVLDNFEQIIEASQLIGALLTHCPKIKMLITSRIVLNIFGEVEYPVPPLPLPEPLDLKDLNALRLNPAVDLFCQRAQKTRRRFELNDQNAEYVVEICRRLDGLPLALELAAARTKIFSPEALLQRLSISLEVLKVKNQQLPERHQTLRQTIAWSYDLLDKKEQALLSRFSVFVGGSELEAIEAVCVQNGLSDWDFEEGIEDLVDKSLINLEETAARFYMLETIREFASDQLKQSLKDRTYKLAHVQYYLGLAEQSSRSLNLRNEESKRGAAIFHQELANLKAAIDYAIELGKMNLAYRLGLALRPYWVNQGSVKEGLRILEKILSIPVEADLKRMQMEVKQVFGVMHFYFGTSKGLEALFEQNLDFWNKSDEKQKVIETLNHLSWVQINKGKLVDAEENCAKALRIAEKIDDQSFLIRVLNNLGFLHFSKGEFDQAIAAFEKILPIAKELGNERWLGSAFTSLAYPYFFKAKYKKALELAQTAQNIHRKANEMLLLQHSLYHSLNIYFELAEYEKCKAIMREVKELNQVSHSEVSLILLNDAAARIALKNQQLEEAEKLIENYLEIVSIQEPPLRYQLQVFRTTCHAAFAQKKYKEVKRFTLKILHLDKSQTSFLILTPVIEFTALLAGKEENYEIAAKLYHKAQQLRIISGMPVPNSEKESIHDLEKNLKAKLGEDEFQKMKAEGESLNLEEAVILSKEILKD